MGRSPSSKICISCSHKKTMNLTFVSILISILFLSILINLLINLFVFTYLFIYLFIFIIDIFKLSCEYQDIKIFFQNNNYESSHLKIELKLTSLVV